MAGTQSHEAIGNFLMLGIEKRDLIFLGDCCRDGRPADRYAAGKKAIALHVEQVAGFGPDIDQKHRLLRLPVGRAEGIVDGHGRNIDFGRGEAAFVDRAVDFVERVALDRDDHRFFLGSAIDELVVPHHFLERKWHMLLSLEGNELLDIVSLDWRQFDETGKDGLAGNRIANLGLAQLVALHEIADCNTALRYP